MQVRNRFEDDMEKRQATVGAVEARHFQVGDLVDVLCDHNRGDQRVNDWLQGVVVQADYKMVAMQLNKDVYLTDGWMVPDRGVWARQDSHKIRRSVKRRIRRRKG